MLRVEFVGQMLVEQGERIRKALAEEVDKCAVCNRNEKQGLLAGKLRCRSVQREALVATLTFAI